MNKKFFTWLSFLLPLFIILRPVFTSTIPFWFDPARDFLLAWKNLEKPSLIGQPTGIPGIFYGPYWIWLISLSFIFTKDPRLVTILLLVVPYFTLFPYLLSKIFGKKVSFLIFLLFIFSFINYVTQFWNPHLAPLLFLWLVYLLTSADKLNRKSSLRLKIFLVGLVCGLIINFHMSFGIAILLASFLFLLLSTWEVEYSGHLGRKISLIILFLSGVFFAFLPFIFFECRHGFNQTKVVIKTINDAAFYNIAAVGQTGMKKQEIIQKFLSLPTRFFKINEFEFATLRLPPWFLYLSSLIFLLVVSYQIKQKKLKFTKSEKKLIAILALSSLSILFIFLSSKNPVWEYHFIGTEIIFLLLIGLTVAKFSFLQKILMFWLGFLLFSNSVTFLKSWNSDSLSISSLASKKYIVEKIYKDTEEKPFSFFAYSPAIYTYDYDYLFKWLGEKNDFQSPQEDISKADLVYLIIPPDTDEAIKGDFINYKTPNDNYKTLEEWKIKEGTSIIKRVKKNLDF